MVLYMICLDSSGEAGKVYKRSLEMIERTKTSGSSAGDVEVLLVAVAELYSNHNPLSLLSVDCDPQILDKANRSLLAHTNDMLENLRRRLEQRGVNARVVVEAGDPRSKLCEVAERERPDLMVIGHRTTNLPNLVQLGSVALHCIEHSPASVLVVRV